jgi:hypothetical protein
MTIKNSSAFQRWVTTKNTAIPINKPGRNTKEKRCLMST